MTSKKIGRAARESRGEEDRQATVGRMEARRSALQWQVLPGRRNGSTTAEDDYQHSEMC